MSKWKIVSLHIPNCPNLSDDNIPVQLQLEHQQGQLWSGEEIRQTEGGAPERPRQEEQHGVISKFRGKVDLGIMKCYYRKTKLGHRPGLAMTRSTI